MIQTVRFTTLGVLALGGALAGFAADATAAQRQPVLVYLYTRMDDHINWEFSEDRFKRVLPVLERIGKVRPEAKPSCLLLVSGASTEMLVERDGATKVLSSIKEARQRGLVEVGYDGENEPTHLVRPLPNFRNAKSPQDRWLARTEAYNWFLNEHKHRLNGEPDPSRPGGLKYMQQVFGEAATVFGVVTMELGSDPELAHQVRLMNQNAILPGIPENDTWPARNLDGFGGSVQNFSDMMSPGAEFAPELYYQSNYLRLSNMSRFGVRTVVASGGREAFEAMLKSLDRSKAHVIRVHFGNPLDYVKPDFNRGVINPLRYAYENPKRQRVMEASKLTAEETNAAYAKEAALLEWLATDFMAANPGSRFVSAAELKAMAQTATGTAIPIATLRTANKSFLQAWTGTNPPDFAVGDGKYFSLADMFYLLSQALGGVKAVGNPPESIKLEFVYGPAETPDQMGNAVGSVSRDEVVRVASDLAAKLRDTTWRPVPANQLPAFVTAGNMKLNTAQFLRLMAEALDAPAGAQLKSKIYWTFSGAMDGFPRSRARWEEGDMWTSKPAPLSLKRATAMRWRTHSATFP